MKDDIRVVKHGLNDLAMMRQAAVEVAKQFSEGFGKDARNLAHKEWVTIVSTLYMSAIHIVYISHMFSFVTYTIARNLTWMYECSCTVYLERTIFIAVCTLTYTSACQNIFH